MGSLAQSLRVLHLGKFYPPAPGGIETHVRTLAQAQAALGAKVTVLCINHLDSQGRDVTDARWARTRDLIEQDGPVCLQRVGRWAQHARFDVAPSLPTTLRALIREEKPDILHLHTPNPAMTLALMPLSHSAALVITHHSDVVRQRLLNAVFSPIEKAVYRRASLLLASSEAYAQSSPVLSANVQKVRTLPLGIDTSSFLHPSAEAQKAAPKFGYPDEGPLWLSVGRLVYYKGFETGLRALAHVPGRWLVVGTGPLASRLKALSRALGVQDRVIWAGHLSPDELVGAYHAAAALWFPSNARSEGFGLTQVEAMASGCPVINTAIPGSGTSWVSPHGLTGLTVPVDDPLALANAARQLWENPSLRQALSARAIERARDELGAEKMAQNSLRFYREAMQRVAH